VPALFECVINLSTGRREEVERFSEHSGGSLCDVHRDEHHNRSVYTLIAERDQLSADVRRLIEAAMEDLDIREHVGVHPRLGVVDVVPFVALGEQPFEAAVALRDETGAWIAASFQTPVFYYGPLADGSQRTLPEIRQRAFATLAPDVGPPAPHPSRGASAVGARGVLVAWNLWVRGITLDEGRAIARAIRGDVVRALAFPVGEFVQISCNLVEPERVGPADVYDQVAALLPEGAFDHAELVGLVPAALLERVPRERWVELDLSPERTIEAHEGR